MLGRPRVLKDLAFQSWVHARSSPRVQDVLGSCKRSPLVLDL